MNDAAPQLVEATRADAVLLNNLLALYAYDFSEILGLDIGPDGSFGGEPWPWDDPRERSFILRVNDLPAGFAIARPGSMIDGRADVWDMHEFFVLRHRRRAGLGRWLAHAVWERQPGTWDVRVVEPNVSALAFWRDVVSQAAGRALEPQRVTHARTGKPEHLFRFEPRRRDPQR